MPTDERGVTWKAQIEGRLLAVLNVIAGTREAVETAIVAADISPAAAEGLLGALRAGRNDLLSALQQVPQPRHPGEA